MMLEQMLVADSTNSVSLDYFWRICSRKLPFWVRNDLSTAVQADRYVRAEKMQYKWSRQQQAGTFVVTISQKLANNFILVPKQFICSEMFLWVNGFIARGSISSFASSIVNIKTTGNPLLIPKHSQQQNIFKITLKWRQGMLSTQNMILNSWIT